MSRWFRHYAGLCRDDKLVRVALRSKQSVERVVWVWAAILESASEVQDAGRYDFDVDEASYFLRADEADIHRIVDCLETMGHLHEGIVVNWRDRQFESDRSAERQKRYRERKREKLDDDASHSEIDEISSVKQPLRNALRNADVTVTSPSRRGDGPETETETETDKHSQASPSNVTCAQARGEPNGFLNFYSLFPNKVGRPKAATAYAAAIRRGATAGEIESGVRMYIANKPPDRQWLNPATFLNQDRFRDQPAAVCQATAQKQDKKQEFWNAFDRVDQHFNSRDEQGDILVPFKLISN